MGRLLDNFINIEKGHILLAKSRFIPGAKLEKMADLSATIPLSSCVSELIVELRSRAAIESVLKRLRIIVCHKTERLR